MRHCHVDIENHSSICQVPDVSTEIAAHHKKDYFTALPIDFLEELRKT